MIDLGTIGTRHVEIETLVRTLPSTAQHLVFVYEAGPCGDWLDRDLCNKGYVCWGVAPSLIPQKVDDRVNTDCRDAVQWARLMRSGDLTPVDVPTVDDAAIRDLCRARADAIADLKAATCRLTACLRQHASRDPGQATWSPANLRWLSDAVWPTPAPPMVFPADVRAVPEHTAHLPRLAQVRQDHVQSWRVHPVVDALQALRGVPCIVGRHHGRGTGRRDTR